MSGMKLRLPNNVKLWIDINGCSRKPRKRALPDADPEDGSTVRVWDYAPCDGGSEVVLYEIVGGGHAWPGGWSWQPEVILGPINRDIDASREIWKFFRRHKLSAL